MQQDKVYICIDLKSFYASVECVERGLDPLTTNLVVADPERTEKTICLAVSPSMKELGVSNRCRVFQIPANIEYIKAVPRMQLYIDYSAEIYGIYLKYISKEDIHVYSIDEAFMDVTDYLSMYQMSAKELSTAIMQDIYQETGITATCGIGTNLYLAKIALDITAKHAEDHIGILDEAAYQKTLWDHKPLTDFWRIGKGTAERLRHSGISTMREISLADEALLYKLFGIDAELLIDHAWGRETTTIADIKAYKPKSNSISSGQVLGCDYHFEDAKLVVKEMADLLSLELVDKGLVTDSITLYIGYANRYEAKSSHGTITMTVTTSSAKQIISYTQKLFEKIADRHTPIHRINLAFNNVVDEKYQQYDLFTDPAELEREHKMQKTMLDIKEKFGKNAILKGMNLEEKATAMERNKQIGGHKSGI
ncbi:Y-family DNA polymerase [Faecalicatena sp. AGMB00832]|uniref:Y-family DNA polymerase n=1 Tax=Faecalicatena faecalis TaxID=2726362 RepID=A0ABS6D3C0_9FIRM|nr:Y-family DNA polymerase [Faecalicatena faecalis]MBU3876078.1 Y-family DNA polymerase [Faecalicatena faecalis]